MSETLKISNTGTISFPRIYELFGKKFDDNLTEYLYYKIAQ